MLCVAWLAVLLSAMSVVYVGYVCRQLNKELYLLESDANAFQAEWGRYLIARNFMASLDKVEYEAQRELHMRVPELPEIVILKAVE